MWGAIVEAYSPTQLTFPSDRLIAISGIAKRMAVIGDNIYLAGLWRQNLETQLLWRADRFLVYLMKLKGCSYSRPIEYRAPSWSWASLDSPVVLDRSNPSEVQVVQVVDVVLEYATEDATGLVTGGWLDLKGTLRLASVFTDKDDQWSLTAPVPFMEKTSGYVIFDVDEAGPAAFDIDNAQSLFFAPLSSASKGSLSGLLLQLRTDVGKGTFERVGFASFRVDERDLQLALADLKNSQPDDLPFLRYEDGKQVYRII